MRTMYIKLPSVLAEGAKETLLMQIYHLSRDVNSVNLENEGIRIELDTEVDGFKTSVDKLIDKTARSFRKVSVDIEMEHFVEPSFTENPMESLLESKQALEIVPGVYGFQGDLLKVINRIDQMLLLGALELGAVEQSYSTLLPIKSMIANSYLSSFPHHAFLVSLFHQDFDGLSLASKIRGLEELRSESLENSELMLSPTVCHHCFEALKKSRLSDGPLIITSVGKCHRFEGGGVRDLCRMHVFTMREIVLYGDPIWLEDQLRKIKEIYCSMFRRWGLSFSVKTATDPFFPVSNESKRAFQSLRKLKQEIAVRLPFSGDDIACISLNNHMKTLVDIYDIQSGDVELESGCVGFGYERLAFALFAQFGMDTIKWPETVRTELRL